MLEDWIMSKYTKQDIIRMVEDEDVEFIRLQFTDMFGTLKNVAVTSSQLEKALNNECMFDGSSIEGFVRIEESDMYLYPDLDTFCIFPWRPQQGKVARIICDIYTADRQPFSGDPRYVLKKAVADAAQMGYQFDVGPECEFFLFDQNNEGQPTTESNERAGYFDLGPVDLGENARRDMVLTLEDMGFEIEASHHEMSPAQHEIDFRYDEALKTADNIMTFKLAVKTIAKRHGMFASFMPKPKYGINGSGMHVNMSLAKDGKNILILTVSSGYSTPYYYKADGVMEAYIRIGNESVIAPSFALNQLILKGMNRTYDTLNSEYDFKDYSFSKLRERYKVWTGNSMEDKLFDSFDIRNEYGKLTNAGALLADDSPIRHSRLFCTRWNGLDKSGGMVDALDSAEYSGSLIILLNEGVSFVKRNMKTRWKKTANSRIEMPDYCERSVFEALVNALIHRDYLILGSEVHIDIYDDRLTIYSPGGMADGTRIQERDISNISSTRRNPVLADIFGRLGYMERQGSGFKKITESYHAAYNYRKELEPEFYSDVTSFQVTLYNLNYGTTTNSANVAIEDESVAITTDYVAIEAAIDGLNASQTTIKKAKEVYKNMGTDGIFGRSDISSITGDSVTAAGNLISKLKAASLIVPVKGYGKGKYRFIEPHK